MPRHYTDHCTVEKLEGRGGHSFQDLKQALLGTFWTFQMYIFYPISLGNSFWSIREILEKAPGNNGGCVRPVSLGVLLNLFKWPKSNSRLVINILNIQVLIMWFSFEHLDYHWELISSNSDFPLSSWILLEIMAVLWARCCVRWAWSDPSCIGVSSWVALFVTKSQPIRGQYTDTWPIRGQYYVIPGCHHLLGTGTWSQEREGRWMETQWTQGGWHAY